MFDKNYLKHVLSVQSSSYIDGEMLNFLDDELDKIDGLTIEQDDYGNLYVTKGVAEIYPCAVSHIDTVHKIIKGFEVVEVSGVLFAWDSDKCEQVGVGGDDKVGIYICLQLLKDLSEVKVAFFRDEEVGCIGSGQAYMPFFENTSMVLQADRRGNGDFISYSNSAELFSPEFEIIIEPILKDFGYKDEWGTITDVGQLKKNGLGVCCANVSCGYYDAHYHTEYVKIHETENCYNLFHTLFTQLGHIQWKHEYVPEKVSYSKYGGGYGNGGWGNDGWNSTQYGNKKKDLVGAAEITNAQEKLDNGFAFYGTCPDCGVHTDFWHDPENDACHCSSCYSYLDVDTVEIIEDYLVTAELGKFDERFDQKLIGSHFCNCKQEVYSDDDVDSHCLSCYSEVNT